MTSEELRTFGKNLGCLKGKTPRQKTPHTRGGIFPLPITILERYKSVTLAGYIMFINGIRFINTIRRHVNVITAEHIANAMVQTMGNTHLELRDYARL